MMLPRFAFSFFYSTCGKKLGEQKKEKAKRREFINGFFFWTWLKKKENRNHATLKGR